MKENEEFKAKLKKLKPEIDENKAEEREELIDKFSKKVEDGEQEFEAAVR